MKDYGQRNIGWIDMLRITACFFVVFAHCCDPFVAHFDSNRGMFLTGLAAVTTFSVSYMLVWAMSRTRITEIFIK